MIRPRTPREAEYSLYASAFAYGFMAGVVLALMLN